MSVKKQGKGAESRKKFTLPAKWREEHAEKDGKMQLKFVSPGKSVYNTEKSVARTLTARNLDACFNASSASRDETEDSEDVEYLPDVPDLDEPGCSEPEFKKRKMSKEENIGPSQADARVAKVDTERRLFVCETTQLTDFVDNINETSRCSTPDCNGTYLMLLSDLIYFYQFCVCFPCRHLFALLVFFNVNLYFTAV